MCWQFFTNTHGKCIEIFTKWVGCEFFDYKNSANFLNNKIKTNEVDQGKNQKLRA